jgi:hypothetical protein
LQDWRRVLTFIAVAITLVTAACAQKPLLSEVSFSKTLITPNADREDDVLIITYGLSSSASVSIYFTDSAGRTYDFRRSVRHGPSIDEAFQVYFSGVVEGYVLPDEDLDGFEVEKRLLQDGEYDWTVEATDETGTTERFTGAVTIAEGDTALPELRGFSVHPPVFSPNRDSIDDRVTINVHLKKDVEELTVYLEGSGGVLYHVEERETETPLNEAGWHEFDYDAGVDRGADPPPDGEYTVYMRASDAMGQWTVATSTLVIERGGVPRAYIYNGEVEWSDTSIPLGATLYFTLTVDNDSNVPIRTSGPAPGTVYDSNQNYATFGEYEQSGAFRVALHCETSQVDHPWRWAVGGPENLVNDGAGHLYLPAWSRAVITGGVRFLEAVEARNPQYCYASLIHEDVEISPVNYRVDPVHLKIQVP